MPELMTETNNALKTDLYELTMAAGYFQNQVNLTAAFELSCHTMPPNRSYLVACGLEQIADYILNLKFTDEDIIFIKTLPVFKDVHTDFFEYLKSFKFSGDVWAMREGEIFFAGEPLLQVKAPVIEGQILETYLLSMLNIQSLVAAKAARIVRAASLDGKKRGVIDFGSRRAHGPQAGVWAARASYIGGCMGTSNVYAGRQFGIPLYGTLAHSWVEAFDGEEKAFESYADVFPENTILLIDTYDTVAAVKKIIRMPLREKLKAVRLDSGNLKILSKRVRKILDQADLKTVKIIASGNLNEYKISELIQEKSPIDIFGVGTDMVTSRDYPALDLTYKLVEIEDLQGKITYKAKRSQGKSTIPGRKQVFRGFTSQGLFKQDTIGLFREVPPPGTQALLRPVIKEGKLIKPLPSLLEIRTYLQERLSQLPVKPGKPVLSKEIMKVKRVIDANRTIKNSAQTD